VLIRKMRAIDFGQSFAISRPPSISTLADLP
jgi:hypothetical protein